jgi:hypothetical protein
MLKTQLYLKTKGIDSLKNRYKIKVTENPTDNRILLNYDQIESPKTAAITRECRGLCLDKTDFSLISRNFFRFYNFGEWRADSNKFDWSNCIGQEKVDGSLISLYYYNDEWQVSTRGSFGEIPFYPNGPTPKELVFQILGDRIYGFNKKFTYALELCSRHNKIVRDYPEPTLFLLGVFRGEEEMPFDGLFKQCWSVKNHAVYTGVEPPEVFSLSSIKEVEDYIGLRSKEDATFEGIIVRDINNVRMKIKSAKYLALHRLGSDKKCLFLVKNLISFVLNGETDELFCYFPETKTKIKEIENILNLEFALLNQTWNQIKDIYNRKEFALSIPSSLRTKSLLFKMKDTNEDIKQIWKNSENLLLKALF